VFFKARNGLELKQLRGAASATPYAGRDFERTDHLIVRFTVSGKAVDGATLTAHLLSRRGDSLASLPFAAVAGQKNVYEIDLPIGSIARGEYLIAIDAAHDADHARTLVPFRAI